MGCAALGYLEPRVPVQRADGKDRKLTIVWTLRKDLRGGSLVIVGIGGRNQYRPAVVDARWQAADQVSCQAKCAGHDVCSGGISICVVCGNSPLSR